jgi:segregation and condensation protein A
MKELQLDIASEYLVMAATLLAIKSKMLLPKHEDEFEDNDFELEMEEDPREELVERLVEYKKYKEAAGALRELEEERGLMYTKAPSDLSDFAKEAQTGRTEMNVSLYDMIGAFQKLLRRKKLQRPMLTKIARQEISLEKRMAEIIDELKGFTGRKRFYDLFPESDKEHVVVTFLAVLELMKRKEISIEQDYNFAEIFVFSEKGAGAVGNY